MGDVLANTWVCASNAGLRGSSCEACWGPEPALLVQLTLNLCQSIPGKVHTSLMPSPGSGHTDRA